MPYQITPSSVRMRIPYHWLSLQSPAGSNGQSTEDYDAKKTEQPTNASLWRFQLVDFPDILNRPLLVKLVHELDYVLLSEQTIKVYGYGKTIEDARLMLKEDLLTLKQDWEEGLINESNSDPSEYSQLENLFCHGS